MDSAVDALQFDGLTTNQDWSVAGILGSLEEYNGTGYRNEPDPVTLPVVIFKRLSEGQV
jgi:lysozyme family protein